MTEDQLAKRTVGSLAKDSLVMEEGQTLLLIESDSLKPSVDRRLVDDLLNCVCDWEAINA
jgi:hypothetical protein